MAMLIIPIQSRLYGHDPIFFNSILFVIIRQVSQVYVILLVFKLITSNCTNLLVSHCCSCALDMAISLLLNFSFNSPHIPIRGKLDQTNFCCIEFNFIYSCAGSIFVYFQCRLFLNFFFSASNTSIPGI